jgi:hypothetical protein
LPQAVSWHSTQRQDHLLCRYVFPSCSGPQDLFLIPNRVQLVPTSQQQQHAAENLYRDANTLIYGDSKPTEDAIDRVVGKINQEYVLFSLMFFYH